MNCPKCGANNIDGSSFCVKCGFNLNATQQANPINDTPIQNNQTENQQPINIQSEVAQAQPTNAQNQQPVNQQVTSKVNTTTVSLNYLMYIIAIFLKPFKSFKEEEAKLSNTKVSIIFTLIVSLVMTIVNLVKNIYSIVRVRSYSLTDGSTYSWEWENIKYIKWTEVIGKNFIIYACVLLGIALVFYLGSLIIKKNLSYIKLLSITTTSLIPAVLSVMIISPLLGMIWSSLSVVFLVAGCVYSMLIFYELMNNELNLVGDEKIYFNLVCLGIIVIAAYYAYLKLFVSVSTDDLSGLLDLLG